MERRDALFPLRGAKRGWEEVRQEFDANFLLCEFKNYTETFDKEEVNQTRNYLRDTMHQSDQNNKQYARCTACHGGGVILCFSCEGRGVF
ncbi:MAG TPA: hypothetical protein VHZ51_17820, partial [Ktedonobacteraceae bacterium]|nr:hypothetical protein [Ktedonobacteraceae bacterium]